MKKILNYEYISECDKVEMKNEEDLNEWMCLEDNEVFVDEMYEKEEEE